MGKGKQWANLDAAPEKHIGEPVIASSIVAPKGTAAQQFGKVVGKVAIGMAVGMVVENEAAKKLVEMGVEKGMDVVGERLKKGRGEIKLPAKMYLVVGATTFGLYEVVDGIIRSSLGEVVLRVPHKELVAFKVGKVHLVSVDLLFEAADGLTLNLEFSRGFLPYIDQINGVVKPFLEVRALPPPPEQPELAEAETPIPPAEKTAEDWIEEGWAHARLGNDEAALAAFEQAIALDPNSGLAYFGKGDSLRMLNRPEEALEALDRSIKLNPNDAPPYRRKGYVLKYLERYEEALPVLQRAIALDPDYAHAYVGLGDTLMALKRPTEAMAAYKQAVRLEREMAAKYGGKADKKGDYDGTREETVDKEPPASEPPTPPQEASAPVTQDAPKPALPAQAAPRHSIELRPPDYISQEVLETVEVSLPAAAGPTGAFMLPTGRRIAVVGASASIGRGLLTGPEAVDVDLTSEQEKASVSRRHAQITRVGNHFELEDLASANGTLLNNEKLVPGRRYRLRNGDIVQFGSVRCRFSC